MKVIFFSSGTFGLPTLKALIASRHSVLCAVSAPDKRIGRGQKIQPSEVKRLASAHDIPVLAGDVNQKAFLESLKSYAADIFVVVSFGQIFSKEFLVAAKRGCINVHASLLPKYRGASPIVYALLDGETETGVTTMELVSKLDAGKILLQERLALSGNEHAAQVSERLADMGAALLVKTLDRLESNDLQGHPQNEQEATQAPKLKKSDARVDWSDAALKIHNKVRAYRIWPGTTMQHGSKRIVLLKTRLGQTQTSAVPGQVTGIADEGIAVACGQGELLIQELKPEGKQAMTCKDFVNGYKLKVGDQLN